MAYLLDAVAILILLFCIWRGGRKGLVHTVLMLVGCLAAALIAASLSRPLAERVFDSYAAPRVEQAMVDWVQEKGDLQVEIPVGTWVEEVSAPFAQYLAEQGVPGSVSLQLEDLSEEGIRTAIAPTIQEVIRPVLVAVLAAAVLALLFIILLVVLSLLVRVVDRVFQLPVLKQANRLGGWLVGAVVGIFWVVVFSSAVRLGADWGLFGQVILPRTVEQSLLVSRMNWSLIRLEQI